MEEFLAIHNQGAELRADSRDVAKVLGIDHESLLVDLDRHPRELEQLGHFRLEVGDGIKRPQGGGRQQKFAYLNFDQILYLLTITRATTQTREFRVRLILAFKRARQSLRPVDKILLSIPVVWQKTFKDDFYVALLRLYGDKFDASENKPSWVGVWTNKFIYEPIYGKLSDELKAKRAAYCASTGKDADWIKLHQFLEQHAKEELRDHITKITTLLQLAGGKMDFIESFAALFHGHTQLKFFLEDLDKDFGQH